MLSRDDVYFYYIRSIMERQPNNRIVRALTALLAAITVGTFGFWVIEGGNVSFWDCLYMTIITLSTVGYGEVIPMTAAGRAFASFLIVFGMGTLLYFASTIVAIWVDLDMARVRRRKKMEKIISQLTDHIIVCGAGTTGGYVVKELVATKTPFVMIERDEARIETLVSYCRDNGVEPLYIVGDATDDKVLEQAGVARAKGLVAALRSDKDNIYIILGARHHNPKMRIVARAMEIDAPEKMVRAGASQVVSPNLIGGLRIASEMIRPEVVEFLDTMMRDMDQNTRFEQVTLPDNSPLAGLELRNTNIRKSTDVLVIAVKEKDGTYLYNPGPSTVLSENATLVVLGAAESVARLRTSICDVKSSLTLIN